MAQREEIMGQSEDLPHLVHMSHQGVVDMAMRFLEDIALDL